MLKALGPSSWAPGASESRYQVVADRKFDPEFHLRAAVASSHDFGLDLQRRRRGRRRRGNARLPSQPYKPAHLLRRRLHVSVLAHSTRACPSAEGVERAAAVHILFSRR